MTPEQAEDYEERAAIMEYDGGLTREEAERAARARVLRGGEMSYQVAKRGHREPRAVAAFPFPSDARDRGYAAFKRAVRWCRANGHPAHDTWIDVEESPMGAPVIGRRGGER